MYSTRSKISFRKVINNLLSPAAARRCYIYHAALALGVQTVPKFREAEQLNCRGGFEGEETSLHKLLFLSANAGCSWTNS